MTTSNAQSALYALFDSNHVLNKRLRTANTALAVAQDAAKALAAENSRLKAQLAQDTRRRKTRVLRPVHASLGLECEYRRRLQCLIDEMNCSVRYWLCAKYKSNEPEVSQLEDEERELALDEQLHKDVLRHAQDFDKLGYLTGAEIETSDAGYWNAHYDFDNDVIGLRKGFFTHSFHEQVHVLLHEAGHRGQAFDAEAYDEFRRLGLDRLKSFVQMANRVHLEDYAKTGEVDGGVPAEVFAESYARWCLDRDMPEELRAFWNARMASLAASDAHRTSVPHRAGPRHQVARPLKPLLDLASDAATSLSMASLASEATESSRARTRPAHRANDGTNPTRTGFRQAANSEGMSGSIPERASDALTYDALPANVLRRAVRKLARRWQKRFNVASKGLARWFALSNRRRSTEQLRRILRDGGWSVELSLSQAQRDILQATIHENVNLIRSIPQQYFTQVEGMVMRSVQAGRDLSQLTKDLQRNFRVTNKRATLIARDQNNKATSALNRTQQIELGITKAIWVHSHAGKTFRRTHIANDGKEYDVRKGWFDPDPKVRRYIQPGFLINCKCFSRSIIPGFS